MTSMIMIEFYDVLRRHCCSIYRGHCESEEHKKSSLNECGSVVLEKDRVGMVRNHVTLSWHVKRLFDGDS